MFQRYYAFCLGLFIPLQAVAQEASNLTPYERLHGPYVALFELSGPQFPMPDLKLLRSMVDQQRKQQIETCEKDEKRLHGQLESARKGLKELNDSSPRDTRAMSAVRNNLHGNIAALEQVLRNKRGECEHMIPAAFESQLAKVRLLERWPQRREQTVRKIEEGRARERKHGDVDDIGYRKLAEDQEKDIALGEEGIRQMGSGRLMPVELQDTAVQMYVQGLARTIARNSDLKIPLHVTVLDSAEINCIGLPGGFLVVTSALILASQTEAELAGVMSQQIAHIAARHATRASKRSVMSKIFVPVAQVATGLFTGGISNAGAYYGVNYGFQGLGMLVDRALVSSNANAQREADQLGIQYAWNAGFDPKGFTAFLDSLTREREYSRTARFFLTKPSLGERLVDAFTEIQFLPPRENYIVDSAEFRKAKERLQEHQIQNS